MSMNDVNLAPGNTGNPIKGATEGADTQALGGGKVAGMSPSANPPRRPLGFCEMHRTSSDPKVLASSLSPIPLFSVLVLPGGLDIG